MSLKNFIAYLQQILSMIDPKDAYSVALGKSALSATIELAKASEKIDGLTYRSMIIAEEEFNNLVLNAKDYVGKPGKYEENEKRRRRLMMTIVPSC